MELEQVSRALSHLLQDALLYIVLTCAILALVTGLLFLISPTKATKINQYMSHWISLRQSSKALETPVNIDHFIYRHHRPIGLFILIGSSYTLYQFAFNYQQTSAISTFGISPTHIGLVDWILTAMLVFTIPVMALTLIFGTILSIRPSALKSTEHLLNRWVSTRKSLLPLEQNNPDIDNWALRYPRIFGAIITISSLYITAVFLSFILN